MGKNAADIVAGMLSEAGSATRAAVPPVSAAPPPDPEASTGDAPAVSGGPVVAEPLAPEAPSAPPAPAAPAEAASSPPDPEPAPRTLRLRSDAAGQLRAAWLLAKREDVLLTAQDFASDLVEEALRARRRRQKASASS